MNSLKILFNNLTKIQKIGAIVALQVLIIIIIVSVMSFAFSEKDDHVEITDNNGVLSQVPADTFENFKRTFWEVIKNTQDVNQNVVNDIDIRDGTYEEIIENNSKSINFIVDIDSIKQTYVISIGWNTDDDGDDISGINIGCPPITEMKYKETFCKGMYTTTDSFNLYFPYYVYKTKNGEECAADACGDDDKNLIYMVDGNEDTNTITIQSSICDVEKYNREALDYIKNSTPFYGDETYTIKYITNNVDVGC